MEQTLNFGFTILDEDNACSASGNHCLAIFKDPESYDSLKECLSDIIADVNTLSSIEVNGITFSIEHYLGGDWKFLALSTGIDSVPGVFRYCRRAQQSLSWSKCQPFQDERIIFFMDLTVASILPLLWGYRGVDVMCVKPHFMANSLTLWLIFWLIFWLPNSASLIELTKPSELKASINCNT